MNEQLKRRKLDAERRIDALLAEINVQDAQYAHYVNLGSMLKDEVYTPYHHCNGARMKEVVGRGPECRHILKQWKFRIPQLPKVTDTGHTKKVILHIWEHKFLPNVKKLNDARIADLRKWQAELKEVEREGLATLSNQAELFNA